MVNRSFISNTLLAALITLTVWALWSLGESRIDAYISLYVLEYAVVKAVLRPRRAGLDWLLLVLIVAFSIIVGFRVYEVLTR